MRCLILAVLLFGTGFLFSERDIDRVMSREEQVEAYFPSELLGEPNAVLTQGEFVGKYWNPLPEAVLKTIVGNSWNEDCPVLLEDLAYIQVIHWNFDNALSVGELIYHKNLAVEIIDIFKELYEERFPIERMLLIDHYGADDDLSMADNNSSAFCSRSITGKPGVFSMHSYGGTIDINPFLNPYVRGDTVLPVGAEPFLDRSQNISGMIKENGPCYRAFIKRGYSWGGHWSSLKDYQHFEKRPDYFIF